MSKEFSLTKKRQKQLSALEITMFEEFTDNLWKMRKSITHPDSNLSDEEMTTIIHNVAWLMNDYLKETFAQLFKK